MPLKKVLADLGRGVWSSSGNKKNQKRNPKFYQGSNLESTSSGDQAIYYEPPDDFVWSPEAVLLPNSQTGEVIVHKEEASPSAEIPRAQEHLSQDTKSSNRAYTEEEFTSAILSRKLNGSPKSFPRQLTEEVISRLETIEDHQTEETFPRTENDRMCENSEISSAVSNGPRDTTNECHCERQCFKSQPPPSPVPERRNKGVLGRLKSFASRTSYSTSEDGHSHSSDYEEPDEEKRGEFNFNRDTKERTSSSWVRHLRRDVKRRISRLKTANKSLPNGEARELSEHPEGHTGSSVESIPSGSGSSLQPPTPTSSNRSSTSAGEDENGPYVGRFLGRARALVDCTPSPYDRDGLGFKKGDVIDIIAKHKTGIWVGMLQGRVGHFKFINVEEIGFEDWKPRHKRNRRLAPHWLSKPETLDELLKQLGLPEYMNVLVLNGYDELDAFKEIEKDDLETLGIVNPEHGIKLLRAAEMLQGIDDYVDDDEEQVRQSPRDSGCYASNENITNPDFANRTQNNNGHAVEADDVDTSHSESGIHSREGPELTLQMNNLDLNVEFSTIQSDTTMFDCRDESATVPNSADCPDNMSSFNILPSQMETDVCTEEEVASDAMSPPNAQPFSQSESPDDQVFVPVTTFADSLVSYAFSENGICTTSGQSSAASETVTCSPKKQSFPKASPSKSSRSNRKSKDKDSRIHSRHSSSKSRDSEQSMDWGVHVHGWASFSKKKDKCNRRRVQEYDDVVSDPAIDPEGSPGRHVYRKTKQRKGSLQELVRQPLPPSTSLLSLVKQKLDLENINLFEEPYSDKTGFCGIPPALVQRYAEELQQNLTEVASAMDQLRITSLQQQARRGVPNDFLADSCTIPVIEANYSSLHDWLVSLGLPMYEANFISENCFHLEDVVCLHAERFAALSIQNHRHVRFLESSIRAMRTRMGSRYHHESPSQTFLPSS